MKTIPSTRRSAPADLCDKVKELGGAVFHSEGSESARLYSWEYRGKESSDLFEDAEDAATECLRHIGQSIGDELGLVLIKKPPTCSCGTVISTEKLGAVTHAAHMLVMDKNYRDDGVEIGYCLALSLIQSMCTTLSWRCLPCVVKNIAAESDTTVGRVTTDLKAAMLGAL